MITIGANDNNKVTNIKTEVHLISIQICYKVIKVHHVSVRAKSHLSFDINQYNLNACFERIVFNFKKCQNLSL